MWFHDKSSFELRQWREYCRREAKAATDPLGHLSGRADSESRAQESRREMERIDAELKRRGDD